MWNPARLHRARAAGSVPVAAPAVSRLRPDVRATAPVMIGGVNQPPSGLVDVEYSFSRTELQPILRSIRETLGCGATPLDSPARLEDALAALIASFGGQGEPNVRRSPAALLTPEYWSIGITRVDPATLAAMNELIDREQPA